MVKKAAPSGQCAHFERGAQDKVAIVLSCPGRHEEVAGKPAAERTGENLDQLLRFLEVRLGRSDLKRGFITITNSWPHVEYTAKTRRSEASLSEVKQPGNIARLERELAHVRDFVIFAGLRARSAKPRLLGGAIRVECCHPGGRGLLRLGRVSRDPLEAIADQLAAEIRTVGQ